MGRRQAEQGEGFNATILETKKKRIKFSGGGKEINIAQEMRTYHHHRSSAFVSESGPHCALPTQYHQSRLDSEKKKGQICLHERVGRYN